MLLADRIDHAVAGAGRGGDPPAVLVLDLDGFKAVNDSFGHAVGDQLLVEVARRLRAVSRATDTVARLGGDEFALLVVDATEEQVLDVADRIMTALQEPVRAGSQRCWVSASIGVRFSTPGHTAGVLLRDADTAMYVAKGRGRGGIQVYEPTMHVAALRRLRQADELRNALIAGEFVAYYQPIIELATDGTVRGVRFNPRSMQRPTMPAAELTAWYDAYLLFARLVSDPRFQIRLRLDPGDLFIVDNRRVLHGRAPFETTSGTRHLQGCYADIDGLHSAIAVLARDERLSDSIASEAS
jgi:diguanylate cyclase (GGDEF)-like protein